MESKLTPTGSKTYGIGEAQVVAVKENAEAQHHVKVFHPDFGVTEFIPFIQTPGMYRVPRIGDRCFVFCNENWTDYPMAFGHKLSKKHIANLVGNRLDNITVIYSSGQDNDRVSHKMEFDDGNDKGIRIITDNKNKITIKDSDEIEVLHRTGSFVKVEETRIELSVKGSSIIMDESGVQIVSAQGAKTTLTDSVVSESAQGSKVDVNADVNIESSTGSSLDIDASIDGNASDANSTFDKVSVPKHTHLGNLGYPTSAPLPGG